MGGNKARGQKRDLQKEPAEREPLSHDMAPELGKGPLSQEKAPLSKERDPLSQNIEI